MRTDGPMKAILFVDDERALLDGLRLRLYKRRHDWNMKFVTSGEEAIAALEQQRFDLVVSDVLMPGMDGGQLLSIVKQRWPASMRIIVSGYSDPAQAVRLTSLAHQFLAKPCDGLELENTIERCFYLQELLGQASLRKVVGSVGELPAMPKIFGLLQAALAQPTVTASQIGDIVNADAAVASKVLQISNSASFRLRKPMLRIKDAVTYLGSATVRNLVLSAEIFSQWQAPKGLPDLEPERLQLHAQCAAAACKALAAGRTSPDDAWLAGLLHDIGYWILAQACPQDLASALTLARAEGLPLLECERRITGASHAEIGAYLLGLWGLPYAIVEAVALHHTPTAVTPHGYDLVGALAVSHAMIDSANGYAILATRPDHLVNADYLARLNAPFDWHTAEGRVAAALEAN
jgi:HD-like signal output (HDOD) protein/ActR/RegA family two-component response regulator